MSEALTRISLDARMQVMMHAARVTYNQITDHIQGPQFNHLCGLPDTLQSWFCIMQLHVWMVLVRARREDQRFLQHLVRLMWQDIEHRMYLMGVRS